MSALADSDPDRPQEQRLAMCFSAWREEHGGEPPKKSKQVDDADVPEPDDDESEDDFIDRCTDELTSNFDIDDDAAENVCQNKWDEFSGDGDGEDERGAGRAREGECSEDESQGDRSHGFSRLSDVVNVRKMWPITRAIS